MDFRGGRVKPVYSVADVLAVAYASVKKHGYHKADSEYPTKSAISSHFNARKDEDRYTITPEIEAAVPGIIGFISNMSGSEFNNNCATLAKQDYVGEKAFGYLGAAVFMFIRNEENKVAASVEINEAPIANIGAKIQVTGSIIAVARFDGTYGLKSVYTIKTESNQIIKMFTTNNQFDKGQSVVVSGKYKGQEVESFARSVFNGKRVNVFEPRTRILGA